MKVTNWKKKLTAALVASGVFVTVSQAEAGVILTGLATTNVDVPTDHGSNLAGAPDVALNWSAGIWDQYNNWGGVTGEAVYQVDGLSDGTVTHTIDFTPATGVDVVLTSLDLNVWPGGGDTDVDWSVTGSASGSLGSGTWSTTNGTVSNNSIGITGTGSETLTLSLTQTSGLGSYLAMDNLSFDQVGTAVPEPTSLALVALGGLGALALRRKK